MTKFSVTFISILLLSTFSCATKLHLDDSSIVESQGLVFSPRWYKRKGKVVDVALHIENKSNVPVYIKRNSILVKAEHTPGEMRNKSGTYAVMGGPFDEYVVGLNVIAENIEISPESSFSQMFAFRFNSKLPDSYLLK
ncbi:MAG: hypothetical protein R3A80_01070 [Bdellovibrionota bacterium]